MSVSIDDLKNDALNIDMIGNNTNSKSKDDQNTTNKKTVVDLNGNDNSLINNGRHTIITKNNSDDSNNGRLTFDLTQMPDKTKEQEEYDKEHFIDNPIANILEGEDSLFGKYLNEKTQEIASNYASILESKELAEASGEIDENGNKINKESSNKKNIVVDDNLDNVVAFSNNSNNKKRIIDDNDILSALNDDDEEENNMNDINEDIILDDEPKDILNDVDEEEEAIENSDDADLDLDSVTVDDETSVEEEKVEVVENKSEDKEPEKKEVIRSDIDIETKTTKIDIVEADLDEEDEIERDNGTDENFKKLQKMFTEKVKPVSAKLDLSSFSVVKKSTSTISQLKDITSNVAKWVLYNQKAVIYMREFTGVELEKLREFLGNGNSLDSSTKAYRMIYDHIESAKPASFETWLKTTPYMDINHLFFAIYISSFKESNFIPFDCTNNKCNEQWISEDIPIMDMVDFESKEDKKNFEKIYKEEDESAASSSGLYVTEIVPINNKIAISFKEPSIYSNIELLRIDSEFVDKYSDIISYLPFIDSIYFIDQENKNLIPVGYKVYENNATKTIKSKVLQFSKALGTLTIDEFGIIKAYSSAINTRSTGMSYKVPEHTCPKCGTLINETAVSAQDLLFTRYQLAVLASTSLN